MKKMNYNGCNLKILIKATRIVQITVIFLFAVIINVFASVDVGQQRTITGKVTDSKGDPLPGVSVVVKGTTLGITTNFDGHYSLEVPADAKTLSFSFVGMKSQEILIDGKLVINVEMKEEAIGLDEVVAIGYGVQKKSNITGAISQVNSVDLANRSSSNAATALQGKVAGVQIMNNSGAPGSSSTIRIRGFSSNGISNPLYIVDGLKVKNIDFLDADNIASIEILKDGASAAIYGAEAGNGVILVTTKTGKKGGGKIFVNTQQSFSEIAKKIDLLNADDYIQYLLEAAPGREDELNMFYYNDPSAYVNNKLANTNWQDQLFSTGYRQRYTAGFQNGNEKGSIYVSLNYEDQDGIITGSKDSYKRITGQLNSNYQIKEWFDIGVTNSIETSKTKQVPENDVLMGSTISQIYILDPLTPVEYSNGIIGTPLQLQDAVESGWSPVVNSKTGNYYGTTRWAHGTANPLARIELDNSYTENFQINGTLYANLKPVKNLVLTSRLGYRYGNFYSYNYSIPSWMGGDNQGTKEFTLSSSQTGFKYYQLENFANYSLEIGKSTFSALAGMSINNSVTNYVSGFTNQLQSNKKNYAYLDYSTSTANDNVGGTTNKTAQVAYYGRASWNYADKYNVQVNFRADSYDAAYLDLEHNWGYFPSVSAGWTVTNESFAQNRNQDLLSYLKLRASYGKNGSISNLGGYMYSSSLNAGATGSARNTYYMDNSLYTGIYPSSYLANPKLRWEESVQMDIGLDLRLFKSRLSLTADYFNKNTDGLLIRSTANLTTGTSYVYQNVGMVNNHGYEFDLEWKDNVGKDFTYSIKANISTVSNNVDKYKGEGVRIQGSSLAHGSAITFFEEGYPIWYLRGFKVDHIDPSNGQPIFQDIVPDGVINQDDKTYLGSGIPDFTYGATLSLTYKNFDLSIYGSGAYGNQIFYGVARTIDALQNRPQFVFDERWTSSNPNASRAAPYYYADPNYTASDAFVFDASYFKVKQFQLGYNLPKSVLRYIDGSEMRIYASIDNFFTFTSYPGVDPEIRPNSSTSMAIDFGGYPVPKTVMFGVNLTF